MLYRFGLPSPHPRFHWMLVVSGQFHALAALFLAEEALLLFE
jgi:hypothetical protein